MGKIGNIVSLCKDFVFCLMQKHIRLESQSHQKNHELLKTKRKIVESNKRTKIFEVSIEQKLNNIAIWAKNSTIAGLTQTRESEFNRKQLLLIH